MVRKQPDTISPAQVNALRVALPTVDLKPGEMHVAGTPTLISSVLGSCVSICLYSPEKKIGAMCHCLLPSRKQGRLRSHNPCCCVDSCVSHMVETLASQHGVQRHHLQAKLFGGASVLESGSPPAGSNATMGCRNIEAARQVLQEHALKIAAERVGGVQGYRLFFHSGTGEAFLRHVRNSRRKELPP